MSKENIYKKYKEIYKNGAVLKSNNPPYSLFIIDKLELDNESIYCYFYEIKTGKHLYHNIFHIEKNYDVQG